MPLDAYDYMTQGQRDPYKLASIPEDRPPRKRRHRQRDVMRNGRQVLDAYNALGRLERSTMLGESSEEWAVRMLQDDGNAAQILAEAETLAQRRRC